MYELISPTVAGRLSWSDWFTLGNTCAVSGPASLLGAWVDHSGHTAGLTSRYTEECGSGWSGQGWCSLGLLMTVWEDQMQGLSN